jgi:hypothetical protein
VLGLHGAHAAEGRHGGHCKCEQDQDVRCDGSLHGDVHKCEHDQSVRCVLLFKAAAGFRHV